MDTRLPEIKEYEIGGGRMLLSFLYALGSFTIFILLLVALFTVDYSTSPLALVLIIPGLALTGFATFALAEDIKGVLTIDADKLTYSSVFGTRALLLSDIRGFRAYQSGKYSSSGKVIIIFPNDKSLRKIALSQYVQNQKVLLTWLSANFPNTDFQERLQDEMSVLQNPMFGATKEERQKNLATAQNVAIGLNVFGCILAVALFFVSKPHAAFLTAAIAYVPLSFLAAPWSKGLIYFNNKTNSAHPWLALGIIVCSIALMTRSLFNYQLLDYAEPRLWICAFLLSLALTGLMLMATAEFSKRTSMDIGNVVAFWLFYFMFGLGTYIISNCELDHSDTQSLTTTVVEKRVSKGKNDTDYYLKIKPVAPVNEDEIHVSQEFFSIKEVGNEVTLYARQGRWGTPWYYFNEGE